MESVALMTKAIGIVTPLIPSIIVVVAQRLILYRNKPQDCIVQGNRPDSYHTWKPTRSVLYMGFGVRKRRKRKRGSPTCLCNR